MLDKLEKIQLLTGGVLVSLLFGLFFWPGLPTPVPDFKAQKYNEDMPIFKKRLGADGQQMLETSLSKADTLAKRKMPQTQSIPRESRPVGRDLFDTLADERNVMPELDRAVSVLNKEGTELTITKILPGSMLHTLGIDEGDVITALDGAPIPFNDRSAMWALYKDHLARVRQGKPVIFTIKRGGRFVQKVYVLER